MSSNEWIDTRLSDCAEKIVDNRGKTPPLSSGGHELIETTSIVGGDKYPNYKLISKYVSKETYDTWFRNGHPQKGDVLVATVGANMGNVSIMKENRGCVAQNLVAIRTKKKNVESNFLYYFLSSKETQAILRGYNIGSAQPNLKVPHLLNLIIKLPSLSEQKTIADTLSCLDDKIEINNRINKTLEEIAQAIFKSWFVDFEPFQDGEFVDSELGRIPKGWRVGTLGEVIEVFDSKRIPLSSRKRETMQKKYPYYGAASLMDYVDDYIFEGTYVLLGEDGTVIDSQGYPVLQYVWGKFWVNNHAHILKGKNGFNEDSIYMLLKNTNVQGIVTGAVQLKINQANLKSVKTLIPPNDEIKEYNQCLEPLFTDKRRIIEENQTLTAIRDSLLPKLMSGEIRVPLEEVQ